MNRWTHLLLLVPLLLPARIAQAGSIETKERMARMACLSGDFTKGVSLLSELFVDTEDPAYIYSTTVMTCPDPRLMMCVPG